MNIVYSEDRDTISHPVSYHLMNATGSYITHYRNSLYLGFLLKNSNNFAEKQQAGKELGMAEKKMAYWQKHPNFDKDRALVECEKSRKEWGV